jgi:hypothetical protein
MISLAEAAFLYELARRTADGVIVEVGSYRGRSAIALAHGSMAGHRRPVFAIDPQEEFIGVLGGHFGPEDRAAFYRNMLHSEAYSIVRLVNLSSEIVAPGWKDPVGLLWIDGDHTYEGVLRDWSSWAPHLLPSSHVAFDDARDLALGPYRLISTLLAGSEWEEVRGEGKVRVIRRTPWLAERDV